MQVAIGKRVRKLDFELDALYINGSLYVVSAAAPNRDWKFPNKQMQKLVSDLHKHHTTRHLMSFFESTSHARNQGILIVRTTSWLFFIIH